MRDLVRQVHTRSPAADWLTEKGLTRICGAPSSYYPEILSRELGENGLDAAESAKRPPVLTFSVARDVLSVQDDGPGIPERVVLAVASPNYISSKDLYVSPSHGAIGQGLKDVWAMPFVGAGARGYAEIESVGKRWRLAVDPVTRRPSVAEVGAGALRGTRIDVFWPGIAAFAGIGEPSESGALLSALRRLLPRYALVNPHAAFTLIDGVGGTDSLVWRPSNPAWAKWRPCNKTPVDWYSAEDLHNLLRGYLEEGRGGRFARDILDEFAGLSQPANQRAVLEAVRLPWDARLLDLADPSGGIPESRVEALWTTMHEHSRRKGGADAPLVDPRRLGVIGARHLGARLVADFGVEAASIRSTRRPVTGFTEDGVPFVVEAAAGLRRDRSLGREILMSLNWTPLLETADDEYTRYPYWLGTALERQFVEADSPITAALNVVYPRARYTDSGKTAAALPREVVEAAKRAVLRVTEGWARLQRGKRRSEKHQRRELDRYARIAVVHEPTAIQVCWEAMPSVYPAVAGTLNRANARQLLYGCRPVYLDEIKRWRRAHGDDRDAEFCTDDYFTQTILPRYVTEHPDITAGWYICYDDRGHVLLPSGEIVGLGTLAIDRHIAKWNNGDGSGIPPVDLDALFNDIPLIDTDDPLLTILAALTVEKEGWLGHFEAARTAQKFNVAIISAKGIPPTAARTLVRAYSRLHISTGALHDLDQPGFTHVHTLRSNNDRFDWQGVDPLVVDLGLRIKHVPNAPREPFQWPSRQRKDPRILFRAYGLTAKEQELLSGVKAKEVWRPRVGHRIELNHFTSDQFIAFAEAGIRKLTGGGKLIPPRAVLLEGYRRAGAQEAARIAGIAAYRAAYEAAANADPPDLEARVRREIGGTDMSWQEGLRRIVARDAGEK